jgi:hypothetical protein
MRRWYTRGRETGLGDRYYAEEEESGSRKAPKGTNDIPDVVTFSREMLGFSPDAQQETVLRGGRRGIVNCTRQWGKSTMTAAKAVHRAYSVPGSLTLVVTPCARQSGEFLHKARNFVRRLGIRVRGDGHNGLSVAFPKGSRIVGLPENETTIRGFSDVSLLLIDEAARVPDEIYRAKSSRLKAVGLVTPDPRITGARLRSVPSRPHWHGFAPAQRKELRLDVQQTIEMDFQLKLGQTTQEVTVVGTGSPLLQTASTQVGNVATCVDVGWNLPKLEHLSQCDLSRLFNPKTRPHLQRRWCSLCSRLKHQENVYVV